MEYTQIVAEAELDALEAVAAFIADRCSVRVLKAPTPGMVMVRHVDPLEGTPFHLGEVYVTECEVEVDGSLGYGCCLGSSDRRGLFAALVDAVLSGGHPLSGSVQVLLEAEEAGIRRRRGQEAAAAAGTRVDFQVR